MVEAAPESLRPSVNRPWIQRSIRPRIAFENRQVNLPESLTLNSPNCLQTRVIVHKRIAGYNGRRCDYDYCTTHESYINYSLDDSRPHRAIEPTFDLEFRSSMILAASSSKDFMGLSQNGAVQEQQRGTHFLIFR